MLKGTKVRPRCLRRSQPHSKRPSQQEQCLQSPKDRREQGTLARQKGAQRGWSVVRGGENGGKDLGEYIGMRSKDRSFVFLIIIF